MKKNNDSSSGTRGQISSPKIAFQQRSVEGLRSAMAVPGVPVAITTLDTIPVGMTRGSTSRHLSTWRGRRGTGSRGRLILGIMCCSVSWITCWRSLKMEKKNQKQPEYFIFWYTYHVHRRDPSSQLEQTATKKAELVGNMLPWSSKKGIPVHW